MTTLEHRVIFICSPGDKEEIAACRALPDSTMVVRWAPGKADFAKKINYAYANSDAPWVFQAADDLRFHPGWDVAAIRMAEQSRARVIGTNDLGNPYVIRGIHSTHTLINRDYINDFGGTVDGSGLVFSELYDHQYTDNEFVQTAIFRRDFAFAKNSVVEHMHPAWGKAESDSTYEKALRRTIPDKELFKQRLRLMRTRAQRELRARGRRRR